MKCCFVHSTTARVCTRFVFVLFLKQWALIEGKRSSGAHLLQNNVEMKKKWWMWKSYLLVQIFISFLFSSSFEYLECMKFWICQQKTCSQMLRMSCTTLRVRDVRYVKKKNKSNVIEQGMLRSLLTTFRCNAQRTCLLYGSTENPSQWFHISSAHYKNYNIVTVISFSLGWNNSLAETEETSRWAC